MRGRPDQRISLERYGISDVNVVVSAGMTLGFLMLCLAAMWWIFKMEYKLKA